MTKKEENTHQTQETRNLEKGAFLAGILIYYGL